MNHEGSSPELSCSKVISVNGPIVSSVIRTNPSMPPRANVALDSPLPRSEIKLCSFIFPLIPIVTLAVVPEFFQTPVLITTS